MKIVIGIDPGKITGVAVKINGKYTYIKGCFIHEAFNTINDCRFVHGAENMIVYIEDARKRRWFGKDAKFKQQGAGSIKRDCIIWEDFLTDFKIPFQMLHPIKGGTKINANVFIQATGWKGRTNEHARDAAMLILGR